MITATRLDAFRQEIEKAGLTPPETIIADGKLHRFASNGDRADDAGWYTYFPDETPAGVFGCWRKNFKQTWSGKADSTMTPVERERQRVRLNEARRQREQDERLRHAEAAELAHAILDQATAAPDDHPYLLKKQIHPHGLRVDTENRLIVPVHDAAGCLQSLQLINADGEKRFLPGGRVASCFHLMGDVTDVICLAEGFATAASVHEAMGHAVAVAFSAGNLQPVAQALRAKHPLAKMIVCGDHDQSGVGQAKAREAAEAVGGVVVLPEKPGQDFNDVHVQLGLDAIKEMIATVIRREEMRTMNTAAATADTHTDSWPQLDEAAYHGLLGEFVKDVIPYSEADSVGLLLHMLLGVGCLIGRNPHVQVEHHPHHARLNVLLVGKTANARKGTAWSTPRLVLSHVDEPWVKGRVRSGLSSGEGLVYNVRDAEGGDPGECDKRLFVIEQEFAGALKAMQREGNTLSARLREAWDHGTLTPMTKRDRLTATETHICVMAHITETELLRLLSETERCNGFANRFLIALVKRSKFLPSGNGAPMEVLERYFSPLSRMVECAAKRGALRRDDEAERLWSTIYPRLEEERPGLSGAILARGAAQVLRLSLIYSLLDPKEAARADAAIRSGHLLAALAVWDYCKASVLQIFGDAIGDPVADRLLRLIKQGPQTGNDLYDAMGKHQGDRASKETALALLQRLDLVHFVKKPTNGRPIEEWHYQTVHGCALCAKRG